MCKEPPRAFSRSRDIVKRVLISSQIPHIWTFVGGSLLDRTILPHRHALELWWRTSLCELCRLQGSYISQGHSSVFLGFASLHFQNHHHSSSLCMYKKMLEAVDSSLGWFGNNDFRTGHILCGVFFEEDEIIDILECENFEW